jgi:hypothetical protein
MSIKDSAELEPDPLEGDDLEYQIHLDAAALVKQWELLDPRDAWRHTGEPPPATSDIPSARPEPYRTPQSVVDAFLHVVRLGDADYLSRWLAQHPADAPHLLKIWERKNALA